MSRTELLLLFFNYTRTHIQTKHERSDSIDDDIQQNTV